VWCRQRPVEHQHRRSSRPPRRPQSNSRQTRSIQSTIASLPGVRSREAKLQPPGPQKLIKPHCRHDARLDCTPVPRPRPTVRRACLFMGGYRILGRTASPVSSHRGYPGVVLSCLLRQQQHARILWRQPQPERWPRQLSPPLAHGQA